MITKEEINKVRTRARIVFAIGKRKDNYRMMNFANYLFQMVEGMIYYNQWNQKHYQQPKD